MLALDKVCDAMKVKYAGRIGAREQLILSNMRTAHDGNARTHQASEDPHLSVHTQPSSETAMVYLTSNLRRTHWHQQGSDRWPPVADMSKCAFCTRWWYPSTCTCQPTEEDSNVSDLVMKTPRLDPATASRTGAKTLPAVSHKMGK